MHIFRRIRPRGPSRIHLAVPGNPISPTREVGSPGQVLLKLMEDCYVESVAIVCDHLKGGVGTPEVGELLGEMMMTTREEIRLVLTEIGEMLQRASS